MLSTLFSGFGQYVAPDPVVAATELKDEGEECLTDKDDDDDDVVLPQHNQHGQPSPNRVSGSGSCGSERFWQYVAPDPIAAAAFASASAANQRNQKHEQNVNGADGRGRITSTRTLESIFWQVVAPDPKFAPTTSKRFSSGPSESASSPQFDSTKGDGAENEQGTRVSNDSSCPEVPDSAKERSVTTEKSFAAVTPPEAHDTAETMT